MTLVMNAKVREVARRWQAGESAHAIGASLGLAYASVRTYLYLARKEGLLPGVASIPKEPRSGPR